MLMDIVYNDNNRRKGPAIGRRKVGVFVVLILGALLYIFVFQLEGDIDHSANDVIKRTNDNGFMFNLPSTANQMPLQYKDIVLPLNPPFDEDWNMSAGSTISHAALKVIVMSYMRSGSTFLGEIFNQNPKALYWFEPIDGMLSNIYGTRLGWFPIDITQYVNGSNRLAPMYERRAIQTGVTNLLDCDLNRVPIETTAHDFVRKRLQQTSPNYVKCFTHKVTALKKKQRPEKIDQCKQHLKNLCPKMFNGNLLNKCHERLHGGITSQYNEQLDKMSEYIMKHSQINRNITLKEFKTMLTKLDSRALKINFTLDDRIVNMYKNHNSCVSNFTHIFNKCSSHLIRSCSQSKFRAIKVIRLTMTNIADILEKDASIRVIHLLRDPRAIAHSRTKSGVKSHYALRISDKNNKEEYTINEALMICHKMRNDIKLREELKQVYKNNFLEVRYESIATNTKQQYLRIYNFLRLQRSEQVEEWIDLNTNAKKDSAVFGTARQNSTITAYKWEMDVTYRTVKVINEGCKDILSHLGYLE